MIAAAGQMLEALADDGLGEREIFVKRGRSRRLTLQGERLSVHASEEEGWAVRAGTDRGAFFLAASGEPEPRQWPEPDGASVKLPWPVESAAWNAPPELDATLLVEGEARSLIESVARALGEELSGARLVEAVLEDGASESWIANGKGVEAQQRRRIAGLRLVAVGREGTQVHLLRVARAARQFGGERLGRDLASRLSLAQEGKPLELTRGEFLISPGVAVRLLAAMAPLWYGADARRLVKSMADREGLLATSVFDLMENLRRHDAPLQVSWDGEGLPTGQTLLVEGGRYCRPVVGRLSADPPRLPAVHCCRRAGWRDRPSWGLTQLLVRPQPRQSAAELVWGIKRGCYLLDCGRPAQVDLAENRFRVPVCGWQMEGGAAREPVRGSVLTGGVTGLLRGILAVAADLVYEPLGATVYGSPSWLVTGVELVKER